MAFRRSTPSPDRLADARRQAIAETSAFLTWALAQDRGLPRIPRRRVEEGGYTAILRRPGARAAVSHWWYRALDQIPL